MYNIMVICPFYPYEFASGCPFDHMECIPLKPLAYMDIVNAV